MYSPAGVRSVMLFRPQKELRAQVSRLGVEVVLCLEAFTGGPLWYGELILYGGR